MNRGLILVIILIIFLAPIAFVMGGDNLMSQITFRYHQVIGRTTQVTINDLTYDVEVANTDSQRAKGLSGRDSLRNNTGMLFIFSESKNWGFWMKDTNVPLDIIWIENNRIVDIKKEARPTEEENPVTYYPVSEAKMVLEFIGGTATQNAMEIDQLVNIDNIDKFTN
ncbi:DUF192 domain-containing protein [Patescibacteria group bacterium]